MAVQNSSVATAPHRTLENSEEFIGRKCRPHSLRASANPYPNRGRRRRVVALLVRARLIIFPIMPNPDLHSLPRLERRCYQAFAAVHWTMKVEPPVPGWLTEAFHQDFRTLLLHAGARERLFCPAYCLMPDHLHLMWLGLSVESDQLNGMKFLRMYLNRVLAGRLVENRKAAVDSRPQPQTKWELH